MTGVSVSHAAGMIQIEQCGGEKSCVGIPSAGRALAGELSAIAEELAFCPGPDSGPGSRHRALRVSLSGCANGCSRPQVADIGIIGAVAVRIDLENCTGCGACAAACREKAIDLDDRGIAVVGGRCLFCGECIAACPFDAIRPAETGFRVFLGGKLGRHPRLGTELPGFRSEREVAEIMRRACRELASSPPGTRLGDLIGARGTDWIA